MLRPANDRMTGAARWIVWLPPFLVGAAGAAAAEISGALMMDSDEGFLRALTVVMTIVTLSFASSVGPGSQAPGPVRRRWLLTVLAFAAAAVFSAAWDLGGGFSAAPPSQALGLGLVGALPLFAVGSVLGTMTDRIADRRIAGPAAALGAAGGFLFTGLLGIPSLQPASLYLVCVVAVSVGALVHGWILDRRVLVRPIASCGGTAGEEAAVELEERILGAPPAGGRIVTVSGRVADGVGDDGSLLLPWQQGVRSLLSRLPPADRILVVGVATGGLPTVLSNGGQKVVTLEPRGRIRELIRAAEEDDRPADPGSEERGDVAFREPGDFAGEKGWFDAVPDGGFGAIIVNLRLLPGGGFMTGAEIRILEAAAAARSPDGFPVLGGVGGGDPVEAAEMLEWIASRPWAPSDLTHLMPVENPAPLLTPRGGNGGGVVFGRGRGAGDLPSIPSLHPVRDLRTRASGGEAER